MDQQEANRYRQAGQGIQLDSGSDVGDGECDAFMVGFALTNGS